MIAENIKGYKEYIRGHGGIISNLLYIPIASFLVERIFMKMGMPPTPVTLSSIIFGVLSVIAFLFGGFNGFLTGAILLQLSYILDCADGQVARLKNMQSDFGGTLDFISDLAVEMPLYFAITFALYKEFATVWIWVVGFAVIYGIFMSHYLLRYLDSYEHTSPREILKKKFGIHSKNTYFGGGTNAFLIFVGAIFFSLTSHSVFNSMCLTLMLLAIVYNFHWVSQFLISLNALRKPRR